MASEKISAMPAATTIDDADLFCIVQGGVNKKVPWSVLKDAIAALPVSTFTNDVDYAELGLAADGQYLFLSGGQIIGSNDIQNIGGGNVNINAVLAVQQLNVAVGLFLGFLAGNGILRNAAGVVAQDDQMSANGMGTLNLVQLIASAAIEAAGGMFSVTSGGDLSSNSLANNGGTFLADSSGEVMATTLHSAGGADFTGPVTTLDVQDGIVIGAT